VSVVAAVSERTLTLALIEVLARDFRQSVFVLLNQLIFVWPVVYHVVAGDNHERGLTTNWTGSEVPFIGAFVIGGSPPSDALKTESVIARVENSKLFAFGEYGLQTDHTLLVVLFDVGLLFGRVGKVSHIAALGVLKLTLIAVPAFVVDVVLTNNLLLVAVYEMLNQCVFVVLHVL